MTTIENTIFVGKVLKHFTSLDSTNEYALNLISKNKPIEGTVISTYNQAKGRGQYGSNWQIQPEKNLTFSLILYPKFLKAQEQFTLNEVISLAISDFITKYIHIDCKVKWPNDIYINDRKVAGVLIQNAISAHHLQSSVIGIGININQIEFPADLPNATSLRKETDQEYDLDELLAALCSNLEVRYLQLRAGNIANLKADYLDVMYKYLIPSLFRRPNGEIFEGKIIGVHPHGKLHILHQKGEEFFGFKEVSIVVVN